MDLSLNQEVGFYADESVFSPSYINHRWDINSCISTDPQFCGRHLFDTDRPDGIVGVGLDALSAPSKNQSCQFPHW